MHWMELTSDYTEEKFSEHEGIVIDVTKNET